MSDNLIQAEIEENLKPSTSKRLRAIVSDAFAFVRSEEANKAFATVTIEDLMEDQIKRNGESDKSNSAQYNPYSYDANSALPDGIEPGARANYVGGSDTQRPTKRDRVLAIQAEIGEIVEKVKASEVIEVSGFESYTESAEKGAEE